MAFFEIIFIHEKSMAQRRISSTMMLKFLKSQDIQPDFHCFPNNISQIAKNLSKSQGFSILAWFFALEYGESGILSSSTLHSSLAIRWKSVRQSVGRKLPCPLVISLLALTDMRLIAIQGVLRSFCIGKAFLDLLKDFIKRQANLLSVGFDSFA